MHRRDLLRLLGLSALAGATGCDGQSPSPRPEAFSPQAAPGAGFVPDVELVLTAAPGEVGVLPREPTRLWRFTGAYSKVRRTRSRYFPAPISGRSFACAAASTSASVSRTNSAKTRSFIGTAWSEPRLLAHTRHSHEREVAHQRQPARKSRHVSHDLATPAVDLDAAQITAPRIEQPQRAGVPAR